VAHATFAAEQVTGHWSDAPSPTWSATLFGDAQRCLASYHAANISGISIRTLRNKLNEYADGGNARSPRGAGDYNASPGALTFLSAYGEKSVLQRKDSSAGICASWPVQETVQAMIFAGIRCRLAWQLFARSVGEITAT